jgi:hypothetical protein
MHAGGGGGGKFFNPRFDLNLQNGGSRKFWLSIHSTSFIHLILI